MKTVKKGLDEYLDAISKKSSLHRDAFLPWYYKFMETVEEKLASSVLNRHSDEIPANPFKVDDISRALEELHDSLVLTATDKCSSNISFVCKHYYLECIQNELNASFEEVDRKETDIVAEHQEFLKGFGILSDDATDQLPYIYSTCKQHKRPVKFRYITATTSCSLKPLARVLKHCFKVIQKEITKRCRYFDAKFKYKVKSCFISDNNFKTREDIFRLNTSFGNISNLSSFDFETLYTALPHDLIKSTLAGMINDIFVHLDKKFLRVTPTRAYFSDSDRKYKGHIILTKEQVLKLLRYMIDNSFVSFKGKVYRQWIGIPMGIDPAPFMANLFLQFYENDYIKLLVSEGRLDEVKLLRYTYRYLDDLFNVNDRNHFENVHKSVYPTSLKLNKTNDCNLKSEYLDMDISTDGNFITSKVFDKRRAFPFEVIGFPFINSSNIPAQPSYGIYISQLLRIVRICNVVSDFYVEVVRLTDDFLKKGFVKKRLHNLFIKFVNNYPKEWGKYGVPLSMDDYFG